MNRNRRKALQQDEDFKFGLEYAFFVAEFRQTQDTFEALLARGTVDRGAMEAAAALAPVLQKMTKKIQEMTPRANSISPGVRARVQAAVDLVAPRKVN